MTKSCSASQRERERERERAEQPHFLASVTQLLWLCLPRSVVSLFYFVFVYHLVRLIMHFFNFKFSIPMFSVSHGLVVTW